MKLVLIIAAVLFTTACTTTSTPPIKRQVTCQEMVEGVNYIVTSCVIVEIWK